MAEPMPLTRIRASSTEIRAIEQEIADQQMIEQPFSWFRVWRLKRKLGKLRSEV